MRILCIKAIGMWGRHDMSLIYGRGRSANGMQSEKERISGRRERIGSALLARAGKEFFRCRRPLRRSCIVVSASLCPLEWLLDDCVPDCKSMSIGIAFKYASRGRLLPFYDYWNYLLSSGKFHVVNGGQWLKSAPAPAQCYSSECKSRAAVSAFMNNAYRLALWQMYGHNSAGTERTGARPRGGKGSLPHMFTCARDPKGLRCRAFALPKPNAWIKSFRVCFLASPPMSFSVSHFSSFFSRSFCFRRSRALVSPNIFHQNI